MATSIFGTPPDEVTINYIPHPGQEEILQDLYENFSTDTPASIVEIIASRGWGKTLFFSASILMPFLAANDNMRVMWVAPTYTTAMSPIDDVFKGTDEVTGKRWIPDVDSKGNRVWEFKTTVSGPTLMVYNGSSVTFKSADSPDSIVSRGYNLIIIDEAALIEERVFTQQILGTARKAGIKIFIISSPRGRRHWTYKYFMKGQDASEKQYLSFQQAYTKNPFFSATLAQLIKDLPEWLYRQEYLAEFIDDGDAVIRGLEATLFGPEIDFDNSQQEWSMPLTPVTLKTFQGDVVRQPGERRFVVALDLAKQKDFTVFIVMDCELGQIVYYRRLNKTDYRDVLDMAQALCAKYNGAELIFDATGVGAGLADVLLNYDVQGIPFVFTNDSKVDIINKLIVSIEHQEIAIPNITTMKTELSAYTYTLTRTGKISYNAPNGFHDDIVISIALANFYRKDNTIVDEVGVIESIINHNRDTGRRRSFIDEMAEDND